MTNNRGSHLNRSQEVVKPATNKGSMALNVLGDGFSIGEKM